MAFPSLESALSKVSNRYLLVVLAAKRARQRDVVVVECLHFVDACLLELQPCVAQLERVHHALVIRERHQRVVALGHGGGVRAGFNGGCRPIELTALLCNVECDRLLELIELELRLNRGFVCGGDVGLALAAVEDRRLQCNADRPVVAKVVTVRRTIRPCAFLRERRTERH